jgi:hypothetical protein
MLKSQLLRWIYRISLLGPFWAGCIFVGFANLHPLVLHLQALVGIRWYLIIPDEVWDLLPPLIRLTTMAVAWFGGRRLNNLVFDWEEKLFVPDPHDHALAKEKSERDAKNFD